MIEESSPQTAIVDTDVVSYLFKGDTRASRYLSELAGRDLAISFMTLAELHLWAESRHWGAITKAKLERFLHPFTVVYPDAELCRRWGEVMTAARFAGRPIGVADAWIAATALDFGVPLVTNNPSDFAGIPGLQILTSASQ